MQTVTPTHKRLPLTAAVLALVALAALLVAVAWQPQAQLPAAQSAVTSKVKHPAPTYLILGTETLPGEKGGSITIPVYRANLGSWQYDASPKKEFGQDVVYLGIRYDDSSVASLKAYVEINKKLAAQLAAEGGTAHVMVTFRSYIAPEQFRAWTNRYGINLYEIEMRGMEANGLRSTSAVRPNMPGQPDPLLQSSIDRQFAAHRPGDKPATFNGIFMTRGEVDASQLTSIANDPLVFLADVTTEYATRDLAAAQVKGADKVSSDEHSPIWRMEDYGLQNFR